MTESPDLGANSKEIRGVSSTSALPKKRGRPKKEKPENGMKTTHIKSIRDMRRVRSLYSQEGFSPEQIARRMTAWLQMPVGKAVEATKNPKTEMFEMLGISIMLKAAETGDTSRLGVLLDRIIGPVLQRTEINTSSININAKADYELLSRVQSDIASGTLVLNTSKLIDISPEPAKVADQKERE